MITSLIFDLDGVLADTAKYHFLAWKTIAENLKIPFTQKDNEKLKGISRGDSLNIILKLGNIKLSPQEKDKLLKTKNDNYVEFISKITADELLPGVAEFLDDAKAKGAKIALGSASKNAELVLQKTNLLKYFDAIVDGNSVKNSKPDPEVFLKGAEAIDALPSECIVFEDAAAGAKAAKAAGMYCIGIGATKDLPDADFCFDGFAELTHDKIIETVKGINWLNESV